MYFLSWLHRIATMLVFLIISACVTSISPEVENTKTAKEDSEYYSVYQQFSKKSEAFRDFENKYVINAVFLSGEFMQAFARRYEYLYQKENIVLKNAENKLSFFVSIFSPDKRSLELHDAKVWSVFVTFNGKKYYAESIKQFNEKEPWKAFFPEIITWSHEYLVTVPLEGVEAGVDNLKDFSLNFAHADAHLSFSW